MSARPSLADLVAIRDRMRAARAAAGLVTLELSSADAGAKQAVETFIAHAGADMTALVAEASAVLAENTMLRARCNELVAQLGEARAASGHFQASLMRQAVETGHQRRRPPC